MATILKGKNRNKQITLHQFANDWVMDSEGQIHSLTSLIYTNEEIMQFKYNAHLAVGELWNEFKLRNKRFYKRKKS